MKISSRKFVNVLIVTLALSTIATLPLHSAAQNTPKKVVKTQDDIPRFTYPISGTATALLQSDDATFNAFAAKVKVDVDSVLDEYDIQDHATQRELLNVRVALQLLANDNKAALTTLDQIRSLEDKPDSKLLSGLSTKAMIAAQEAAGQTSGMAYQQAYAKAYAASLQPLPWPIVGNLIKETKNITEILSSAVVLGTVQANIEPAVAKSHLLGNDLAWALIGYRLKLKQTLPLKEPTVAVLSKDVAEHNVQKPDIWEAREVTLAAVDKLTPVNVAIWDTGTDLSLFPGRIYTDAHPMPEGDPQDIAFDLKGLRTHGYLLPLDAQQQQQYPGMVDMLKGISDLQLSIDSPEAAALRKKVGSLSASQIADLLEQINFFNIYSHGTHVAGIAARGNPAIRLTVGRIGFDSNNIPLAPSEELERRNAANSKVYVDWFQANHVRVVNMSWGYDPKEYEQNLEKNSMGKDAADRKGIARKLFEIRRQALYNAIKDAPEILFICAAGNANSNNGFDESIPSSFKLPNLLTVGAVDQAGDEASFTSYGDTVLVDANGYQVESMIPGGYKVRFSGTSMSSPNVTNLAAKLLAINPKLTPEQVIHLIVAGATTSEDGRRHNIDEKRSVELLHQRELQ